MVRLEIPGEPVGKMRPRATVTGGHARVYTPKETVNYESYVKALFVQNYPQFVPVETSIKMNLLITKTVPTSVSQKMKYAMLANTVHVTTKPDLDNIIKTICDALNGVAYIDDKLIVELKAKKEFGEVAKVIVEIEEY